MKYRRCIYYSAAQRAEIWDRWQPSSHPVCREVLQMTANRFATNHLDFQAINAACLSRLTAVLDALSDVITTTVAEGGAVSLPGIGKISTRERPTRLAKSARKGAVVPVHLLNGFGERPIIKYYPF